MASKAEKYISDLVLSKYTEPETIPNIRQRYYSYNDMVKAFDSGVKSANKRIGELEDKNKWHDIIKDPNDLPKAGSHVLVKVTYKENIEQRKFENYNIFIAVYGDGYYFHEIGNTFYELSCYRKDGGEDNLCSVLDNTFAWKEIE